MVKGRKKRTVATTRTKTNGPPSSPLSDASNVWTESQGKASSAGSTRTTPPVTRSSRIDDYFPTLSAGMATAEEVANEHSYSRRRPVKRVPCPLPQLVEPEVQIPCPDAAALPAGLSLTATQPPSPPCTDTQTAATKPSGRSNKSAKSASRATHTSVTKATAKSSAPAAQQDAPKSMKRKVDVQCHSLTEYFPIRRSARKTKTTLAKEKQKHVEDAILNGIEDGFKIIEFADKGRGVTSTRPLKSGDFVLEYAGELIDMQEAKLREEIYAADTSVGCYMYYFTCRNKQYCVDATKETGRLGRLVNHSKRGNLRTQMCIIKGVPHLVLVAQRNIEPGEELLYDYGDRSKASLQFHPWLAL
ncbi:SET domain containing 8 [Amblyomma americanum]